MSACDWNAYIIWKDWKFIYICLLGLRFWSFVDRDPGIVAFGRIGFAVFSSLCLEAHGVGGGP